MQMNRRERKELALSKLVLLALAVLGLFIVVWLAWVWPSSHDQSSVNSYAECVQAGNPVQTSHPSTCVSKEGKRFVNPEQTESSSDTSTSQPKTAQPFLSIKEWGVQVPLPSNAEDLKYAYHTSELGDRTSFTFTRLQTIPSCQTDIGLSMTRTGVKNEPPYNIDNPEPVAHVGSYYYYLAYAGSPCYDQNNPEHVKLVESITGGNGSPTTVIKQVLQKLQATL